MNQSEKIIKIKELVEQMQLIMDLKAESEDFIKWNKRTLLVISKVFGESSKQFDEFNSISFWPMVAVSDSNRNNFLKQEAYENGLKNAKVLLEVMVEELVEFYNEETPTDNGGDMIEKNVDDTIDKIFISHSSEDKDYADLLIQLFNDIGIEKSQNKIFYSSKEAYGIPLNENIFDYLKQELNKNIMVIFILSDNYYNSVACLNEMGATWVNSKTYYTILLPDFSFKKIEGAIDPLEISFKMNDKHRLTEFKDNIIKYFKLVDIDNRIWEEDRDKFIKEVEQLMHRDKYKNSLSRVDLGKIKDKRNGEIEIELRFINNGNIPIECTELVLNLLDEDNNVLNLNVPYDYLEGRFIYSYENRRELVALNHPNEKFNIARIKKWSTDSHWVSI